MKICLLDDTHGQPLENIFKAEKTFTSPVNISPNFAVWSLAVKWSVFDSGISCDQKGIILSPSLVIHTAQY